MWEYVQKREGIGVHVYLCICEGEEGVIVWVGRVWEYVQKREEIGVHVYVGVVEDYTI